MLPLLDPDLSSFLFFPLFPSFSPLNIFTGLGHLEFHLTVDRSPAYFVNIARKYPGALFIRTGCYPSLSFSCLLIPFCSFKKPCFLLGAICMLTYFGVYTGAMNVDEVEGQLKHQGSLTTAPLWKKFLCTIISFLSCAITKKEYYFF